MYAKSRPCTARKYAWMAQYRRIQSYESLIQNAY
jgi:hypothetical protein